MRTEALPEVLPPPARHPRLTALAAAIRTALRRARVPDAADLPPHLRRDVGLPPEVHRPTHAPPRVF